jgi:peptide chain release factor
MTHLPTGIVVKSQATRSRSQNYKNARQILADKIELLEKGDESRVAKKKAREVAKAQSREKKARRKYRALVGAVEGQVDERDVSLGEPKEIREQVEPVSAVTNGGRTGKQDNMTT